MYEATVTVTTKGRKNDLPVKNGELISIIRTTNCPKGKWLARDSSNNCESGFSGGFLNLTEPGKCLFTFLFVNASVAKLFLVVSLFFF